MSKVGCEHFLEMKCKLKLSNGDLNAFTDCPFIGPRAFDYCPDRPVAEKEPVMSGDNGKSLADKKQAYKAGQDRGEVKAETTIKVYDNNEIDIDGLVDNPILFLSLMGRTLTIVADHWLERQVDAVKTQAEEQQAMKEPEEKSSIITP